MYACWHHRCLLYNSVQSVLRIKNTWPGLVPSVVTMVSSEKGRIYSVVTKTTPHVVSCASSWWPALFHSLVLFSGSNWIACDQKNNIATKPTVHTLSRRRHSFETAFALVAQAHPFPSPFQHDFAR